MVAHAQDDPMTAVKPLPKDLKDAIAAGDCDEAGARDIAELPKKMRLNALAALKAGTIQSLTEAALSFRMQGRAEESRKTAVWWVWRRFPIRAEIPHHAIDMVERQTGPGVTESVCREGEEPRKVIGKCAHCPVRIFSDDKYRERGGKIECGECRA